MTPLPRKSLLERLITNHATDSGIAAKRIRHWISTMVILGALDRVRSVDDMHRFVIKGGAAMEIRLGVGARATGDVDMTFHGDTDQLVVSLDEAISTPYSGFTFRRSEMTPIGATGALRTTIKLSYEGKGWMSVELELSVDSAPPIDVELIPAISIRDFRLDGPSSVATLSVRQQIAQKLHAVTETFPTRDNMRVRDVVDLVLLADLAPDLARVRAACIEVFDMRDRHTWPPELKTYDSWPADYDTIAIELAVPAPKFEDALAYVRSYITLIDRAT